MKTIPERLAEALRLAEAFLKQPTWASAVATFDASINWTGEDEERNPTLKKARMLAFQFMTHEHEDTGE